MARGRNSEAATVVEGTVVSSDTEPREFDYAEIKSFDDALLALSESGVEAEIISDYGDGFLLLPTTDKGSLLKVPFVIMEGTFRVDKETDREYLSLRIVTQDGRKLIVNDGSVGMYEQSKAIISRRPSGSLKGLVVKDGLTGGEYTTIVDGEKVKAATYYFAGV